MLLAISKNNDDIPKVEGRVQQMAEIQPTVNAYGICVLTCSIWLHELAIELSIVVSEIGEQWSPNTAPAKTQDVVL